MFVFSLCCKASENRLAAWSGPPLRRFQGRKSARIEPNKYWHRHTHKCAYFASNSQSGPTFVGIIFCFPANHQEGRAIFGEIFPASACQLHFFCSRSGRWIMFRAAGLAQMSCAPDNWPPSWRRPAPLFNANTRSLSITIIYSGANGRWRYLCALGHASRPAPWPTGWAPRRKLALTR